MERRSLLVTALAPLIPSAAIATSPLPPPPPSLRQLLRSADVVCTGTIERFAYRGNDPLRAREEYGRDFADAGASGNRTRDAFLRPTRWFYGAAEFRSGLLRVNQPVPGGDEARLAGAQVYLLSKGNLYAAPDGPHRVFYVLAPPLPATREREVQHTLRDLLTGGEKT